MKAKEKVADYLIATSNGVDDAYEAYVDARLAATDAQEYANTLYTDYQAAADRLAAARAACAELDAAYARHQEEEEA